jgi:hypothetical protein
MLLVASSTRANEAITLPSTVPSALQTAPIFPHESQERDKADRGESVREVDGFRYFHDAVARQRRAQKILVSAVNPVPAHHFSPHLAPQRRATMPARLRRMTSAIGSTP